MFWDYIMFGPLGLLIILPGVILGIYAQSKIYGTFQKYSQVPSKEGITASLATRELLAKKGIDGVELKQVAGDGLNNLYYNPSNRTIVLSSGVYNSTSISAIGVAAHECGHAEQHAKGYFPMKVRNVIIPVSNFMTKLLVPLLLIGMLLSVFVETSQNYSSLFINVGLILYGSATVISLITLPVEFNASKRALRNLQSTGIMSKAETMEVKKVLDAAALTYVASFITSLLYLLRFIIYFADRR